jgi:hypothetical protein
MAQAVNIWDKYRGTFQTDSLELMEAVLVCLEKSSYFLELKFFILNNFMDKFEYQQVDRLLHIFEGYIMNIEPGDSVFVTNLNPVKTSVLIMSYLEKITQAYTVTELRVEIIHKLVMNRLK